MTCPSCRSSIPANGKFCPKCGFAAGPLLHHQAAPSAMHPSRAPIPRAGKIFFALFMLGVALAIAGYSLGGLFIGVMGTILIIIVVLVALFGDAFL